MLGVDVKIYKGAGSYSLEKAEGDAGYDIRCRERVLLLRGQVTKIATGIYLEIPEGLVGLIKNKSSVGVRGLSKTAQVIDPSYRGELHVCLNNNGQEGTITFEPGQKIAQILFVPYYNANFIEVNNLGELSESSRGKGGFGSTGKF